MRDPRTAVERYKARMADGKVGEILGFLIKVPDPTLTGTIWKAPPISYTVYFFDDVELEKYDDGSFEETQTGRPVTLL